LVARSALTSVAELSANSTARKVKEHLHQALAHQILTLGPLYAASERSGELIYTFTKGIEALDAYFSQYLPQLALAGLLPLAYLVVIFPLDPLSAMVLLLTGPLIPVFMFLIGHTSESLARRQFTMLGRMSAYFMDTLQGLATLKTLGRSQEQVERIEEVSDQYRQATMSVLRVTFLSALVLELLSTIGTAIIAVEIGLRLLYGWMDFYQAFFILLLAPDFYLPLRTLGLRFHASMAGISAAQRIFGVLDEKRPGKYPQLPSGQADLCHEARMGSQPVDLREPFIIELEDVHYSYPGREAGLKGISMQIRSGQMTALVGPSGAGKTTLAGILLRFFSPDRGSVRINGLALEEIAADAWRGQIAWVPQHPYLFHGTLADNLHVANPSATWENMRRAAKQAHLWDLIETLPQGFETPLGEGGATLSGGQAQRVALARAFLRDAPLLILDEPTGHLDVEQERILQDSMRRLFIGRTVLVIAHRLPTVISADKIVVLKEGRVVECGNHAGLLERRGVYANLLSVYRGDSVG
jgi:ATP-binding cassette, subfamily C, bacterial CydD